MISERFTSAYLAKNAALIASSFELRCSICHDRLAGYTAVRFILKFINMPDHDSVCVDRIRSRQHYVRLQTAHLSRI